MILVMINIFYYSQFGQQTWKLSLVLRGAMTISPAVQWPNSICGSMTRFICGSMTRFICLFPKLLCEQFMRSVRMFIHTKIQLNRVRSVKHQCRVYLDISYTLWRNFFGLVIWFSVSTWQADYTFHLHTGLKTHLGSIFSILSD